MTTFAPIFVPEPIREAVSDAAWLTAMLDVERALANASALVGIIPAAAAAAIAEACEPDRFDFDVILGEGRSAGNPAEPLVRRLREQVGDEAAQWVHFGATSQDVVDTAAMLIAHEVSRLIDAELGGVAAACARLAEEHRSTQMAARTLLQQAMPTTFGAKSAGWLVVVVVARDRLRAVRWHAQLGGAAGTLAAFGERGPEVVDAFASELELYSTHVPWHALRGPVAALGAALDDVAQGCAKIGLDVVLLAQTEVGEVSECDGGGSSAMPHKRNPTRAVLARACARLVHANVSVFAGGDHEHERAAGAWQAEWTALSEALAHAGGAAWAARECLEGLQVFPERMRENMTVGIYSERDRLGLRDDADYLGSTSAFVDRALERWREVT